MKLVRTGRIGSVHIDVMRPPLIPDKNKFSIDLIRRLYEELKEETLLNIHLMTSNPLKITEDINRFIVSSDREKIAIIVQVEAFSTEDEMMKAIRSIKRYGYRAGIGLNLPTPEEKLTKRIAREANMILVMSVPMGLGGQEYCSEATEKLRRISKRFPDKIIEVDGGINPETIVEAWKAGARVAVVGSYITLNNNPIEALLKIDSILKRIKE
ncbi:MAG: ribulose-phosphate 3-epimerase [Candidatus Bathyarchaeia archaeon]